MQGLPFPKDADFNVDRHLFVNRKIDRFTISCRYLAKGTNSLQKKWSKWRTSFALSFTLKQPKESKEIRLNVFLTGHGFSRFSSSPTGVRNITRQLEVYLLSLPGELKKVAVEEIEDLYNRMQEEYAKPVTVEHFAENIRDLAYPSNNILEDKSVPLFAGELLRARNRKDIAKFLFSKDKNIREQFANDTFTLSVEKLGYALLTKNIIPDAERYKFLLNSESKKESPRYKTFGKDTIFEPNLSYDSLITLTRFLKKLPLENRRAVLKSETLYGIVEEVVKWNSIKGIAFDINYNEIKSWSDASKAIRSMELSLNSSDNNDSESKDLSALIKSIFEDNDFVEFSSSSYSDNAKIAFGDRSNEHFYFSHLLTWGHKQEKLSLGMNWAVIKKNSLIYNIIQNDPYTPYRKQNLKVKKPNIQSFDLVELSAKAGYYFLSYLKEQAEANLAKYHVDITKQNIAKYISFELLLNSDYKLRNIGNKVPTAFYKMLKAGMDMENILFFLQRKVAISTAIALNGMPRDWILKAIGVPSDPNSIDF